MEKHILIVTSQNVPGVLAKMSGILRRKLFNVESLTVGQTSNPEKARFTVIIAGDFEEAQKAAQSIQKMVEILSIRIAEPKDTIRREIVLAKLSLIDFQDSQLLEEIEGDVLVKEIYREGHTVCFEFIDTASNLEKLLGKITQNNIEVLEWVRSGVIAIEKS